MEVSFVVPAATPHFRHRERPRYQQGRTSGPGSGSEPLSPESKKAHDFRPRYQQDPAEKFDSGNHPLSPSKVRVWYLKSCTFLNSCGHCHFLLKSGDVMAAQIYPGREVS